ncbi:D-cysteine desulfhydrase family protein [Ruegeria sp. 2012CJ41-6]|uniref:D-cysteine desulfhydrase family protein n=1 Tax=Ruegeria spongiae TaxID=2942209 RepID=A0ABT0Q3G8_9RHOB|nr:D-cysteine desulfhydrase family protein [Ruegeria spongiae]MCL6284142.1 D-cysteine desulfhydrase family protein [Ruegeria spongiae]
MSRSASLACRASLVHEETPLDPLHTLSKSLGIELHIKRDDLCGAPFGGNKTRQLEHYLGAAQAQRADTILITGAVQSNFVRTAAAAAAALGMQAVVQLEDRVPEMDENYRRSGNVLLLRILGAEIMHYPTGEDEAGADAALRARADALRHAGRKPYVIPLAVDNPPLGALGYLRSGQQIACEEAAFDYVIVASGSGATHAGLLAGLRNAGSAAMVIGSCVRRAAAAQKTRVAEVLRRLRDLTDAAGSVKEADIAVWDGALAPGYGRIGPVALRAMELMARQEGILLDPVYTAKAFAAIPALVEEGRIEQGSRVLFVHTGGLAALFGYQTDLEAAF